MTKLLILTLLFVGVMVFLLGFRVFFSRRGQFSSSHVEDQPVLKAKGLKCHRYQDAEAQSHKGLWERIGE